MGGPAVSLHFRRPPAVIRYFPRAVFGTRAALVPEGQAVPRLQGSIEQVRVSRGRLRRYRSLCGFSEGTSLPITYPHVLSMPLHIALLTHPRFVVRLMGLVHVANEIHQLRPLPAGAVFRARSWIEGFRDADRGQEFDLYTEFEDRDGTAWHEKSTLLARRAAGAESVSRGARQTLRYERPGKDDAPTAIPIDAPQSIGRRYGWLSGDLNPIHLSDRWARRFGFDATVAHGMWSMARSLAALGPHALVPPVCVQVEFKLPLFLPSTARLEHWVREGRRVFALKDGEGRRPHLAGSIRPG